MTIRNSISDDEIAIRNNGSTLNIEDSTISIDTSTTSYDGGTGFCVYNSTGKVTITGNSELYTNRNNSYGIYNISGEITIGTPEDPLSPNYGGEYADVSTTMPNIRAIGATQGIGIKNESGLVNYYDGRITATTTPLPEAPSKVEYLYEPRTYIDTDGIYYTILKWMRG